MKTFLLILTLALVPAVTGAAEPDSSSAPQLVHPSMGTTVKRPSPGVAAVLSHGSLVLPIAASALIRDERSSDRRNKQIGLISLGIVVGPAVGYWYGDVARAGNRGALGRLALAAGFGVCYAATQDGSSDFNWGTIGLAGAGVACAGAAGVWALWDAANVAPRVEARNREVRATSWNLGPAVAPSGAPALALTARF